MQIKESKSEDSGCNPLLLPAFVQSSGDFEVYIQSTSDPVVNRACRIF